ncbi:hypothetical protein [Beijerinckia sp. 28-YEA-48]|uniref:hypothetical protein n=1 Tax=Beijerinckia sp. 28-YEA-48 TaxID=1882748 RepID=UPI00089AE7A3|nr:hypothetical protein [Beijerinckia sp. 28-YEA-48]MDH7797510.1 membrane protein implicated in regulation of membrane protease activity [Beijerinckia sp. GAS462]SEC88464.1 hypothetical protein SAMN05443249_3804 [Beijerinckia sp. 28-YEA-48]
MDGMRLLQFIAVIALGLFVAWIARGWVSWIGDLDTAFVLWFAILIPVAWLVDRRQVRKERRFLETIGALKPENRQQVAQQLIGRRMTDDEMAKLDQSIAAKKLPG